MFYYDDNDDVWIKVLGFFVLPISAALLLFALIYSFKLGDKKRDIKSIECTVGNVNLVKYSNRHGLSRYVYLSLPDGEEIEIEDQPLYDIAKKHIGQKIKIEASQTYFLDNDGKKHFVRNHLVRPVKVLEIYGETQKHEEKIQNVEVRTRTVPVIIQ